MANISKNLHWEVKMNNQNLDQFRHQIDKLNLQILELLNERTAIVELIGREKQKQDKQVYDPVREQQIINQLQEINQGPMTNEMVSEIFKQIFKVSVEYQKNKSENFME